jgi:hypothetical protein
VCLASVFQVAAVAFWGNTERERGRERGKGALSTWLPEALSPSLPSARHCGREPLCLGVYLSISICICMYIYDIYIHIQSYMNAYMHTHIHTYIHTYDTYVCLCVCVCVCM